MTAFTPEQALRMRAAIMQHVGGIVVDQTAPGPATWVISAIHYVLSFWSLFTGNFIPVEEWTKSWSMTIGVFVVFGTTLDPNNVVLVAAHEAVHVLQFKKLGFTGLIADGYRSAMWFIYLFSREGRARLEAEAYATGLELGVRLWGWGAKEMKEHIIWVRDVALPVYGLTAPERQDAANILDSHAAALLADPSRATSALGDFVVGLAAQPGMSS